MLRSVVDDLWLVAGGSVSPFQDDLDGYARWLARQRQTTAASGDQQPLGVVGTEYASDGTTATPGVSDLPSDRRVQKRMDAERRARLAPLTRSVTQHEKDLDKASRQLAAVREKLGDDGLYNDERKAELSDLLAAELAARRAVDAAEEKLLDSMEALELAGAGGEQ
jgi:ATP-binding cassette subfamily F protein 3